MACCVDNKCRATPRGKEKIGGRGRAAAISSAGGVSARDFGPIAPQPLSLRSRQHGCLPRNEVSWYRAASGESSGVSARQLSFVDDTQLFEEHLKRFGIEDKMMDIDEQNVFIPLLIQGDRR